MKKTLAILLVFLLALTPVGCNDDPAVPSDAEVCELAPPKSEPLPPPATPAPEPADPAYIQYLHENFTNFKIDGSTSMIPLHGLLFKQFVGYANAYIHHYRTVQALEFLISGENDVLLSVSYSDELMQNAANEGLDVRQLPITREAFVFLINANNPVQSLTSEQIKGIYSGEITNWSEVGGDDAPITAFQRNADSGSQMRMVKFMGDTPLMDKDVTYVEGMGGIIERIENFDQGKYSIAYNMFTFTERQYPSPNVVMLAVDGVAPTDDTIWDNTYPLVIYNYIYYDANNAEAAEFAENLHAFLMSDDGQKLIGDGGYVNLNRTFDRNRNARPHSWTNEGDRYIDFYNAEKGEFYEPDGQGGLLVFGNYPDYALRDSEYKDNERARELIMLFYNSDLLLTRTLISFWAGWGQWEQGEGIISVMPIYTNVYMVEFEFVYRYNGQYYAGLTYNISEDILTLQPSNKEYFAHHMLEPYSEYMENSADEALEITFDDLKNLYVISVSDDWMWERNIVDGKGVFDYIKPFN